MRRISLTSIALFSFVAVSYCLAASRPRYGGTLRVEMLASLSTLDPTAALPDNSEAAARQKLAGEVFETLVRLDDRGDPQPWLAISWTHDAARKRWLFRPRAHVTFHDGSPWQPDKGVIAVDDRRPIGEILRTLARPDSAITLRGPDGNLLGTGPFRIAQWQPRQSLVLEAYDDYWNGRPYLDRVEVQLGRSLREQALDSDLGKADVIELALPEVRRDQQRGAIVRTSGPVETVALVFEAPLPETDPLRQALALSIDRKAIQAVLLQRQGEASGALLPQWLSGTAFLFPAARNLDRARQIAPTGRTVSFAYDHLNPLIRSIAERVVLNAAEAGITLKPSSGSGDVRLITLRIPAADPVTALEDIGAALKISSINLASGADASALFEAERQMIEARQVVPLIQIPAAYRLSPTVHGWPVEKWMKADQWRLDDVWIRERAAP
jgi:MarR-like DNA-binding transcriptional regulator SgrR of sgrS sRNA